MSSDDVLHPSVRAPTPSRHVTARATMNAIASSTTTLRVAAPGGAVRARAAAAAVAPRHHRHRSPRVVAAPGFFAAKRAASIVRRAEEDATESAPAPPPPPPGESEEDVKGAQMTAIVTGVVSVVLAVGYLALVQVMDSREFLPPPPEAMGNGEWSSTKGL